MTEHTFAAPGIQVTPLALLATLLYHGSDKVTIKNEEGLDVEVNVIQAMQEANKIQCLIPMELVAYFSTVNYKFDWQIMEMPGVAGNNKFLRIQFQPAAEASPIILPPGINGAGKLPTA